MKYSAVILALCAVAMGELTKVPRSNNVIAPAPPAFGRRQAAGVKTQDGAMSTADGAVVNFDTAGVYKAATEAGQ
ncbi:Uu.00g144720.m01.CDS01 [Anthostomella pinea]|uniref:Uu.00g144720.m01.CDS01 n=1 Tax=Anthostomella pinea TaxID=933095 RepID=A0AAI8VQW1_9PEZI|nr:Uu.00g144720.m01.CDS01 [Anthostomella pinea]